MQYKINDAIYDSVTGIFIKNTDEIKLTKSQIKLLNYFISQPKIILTKKQLMDDVWGRVISENSIEKAISKLRTIIEEDALNPKILVTHFGHGISLEAKLSEFNSKQKSSMALLEKKNIWLFSAILLLFFLASVFFYNKKNTSATVQNGKTVAIMLPTANDWLSAGSVDLIEQIVVANNDLQLKSQHDKPKNLNSQQFIEYQWKLTPNLKIIKSKVEYNQGTFKIHLTINQAGQKQKKQIFADENYNKAIKKASQWLLNDLKLTSNQANFSSLLPENNFIMEIYLRGLEKLSKGELKSATNYFEICLNENPQFLPAYLNMARVKNKQENLEEGMAILDTLSKLNGFERIKIDAEILKAQTLMKLNQQKQAEQYLAKIIQNYKRSNTPKLKQMKSLLVSIYINLNKNQQALDLITQLETELNQHQYPELLHRVYYNKARIMEAFGKFVEAKNSVLKAKELSNKLGNLFSESADLRLLSSIEENLEQKNEATLHLQQALAISKALKDNIGVAKTISNLVPRMINSGQFNAAEKLNREMENIVIKFNSNMGAMYATLNYAIIAMHKKQWQKAQIYLNKHREIIEKANNKRALLQNRQVQIELLLAQNISDGVEKLIKEVQQQIEAGGLNNKQLKLNLKKARYNYLIDKKDTANKILYETKKHAQTNNNHVVIALINNLLAQQYLRNSQPAKALSVLTDGEKSKNKTDYPSLLLQSKAYFQLNEKQKALQLAHLCKSQANEFWTLADQEYLNQINLHN